MTVVSQNLTIRSYFEKVCPYIHTFAFGTSNRTIKQVICLLPTLFHKLPTHRFVFSIYFNLVKCSQVGVVLLPSLAFGGSTSTWSRGGIGNGDSFASKWVCAIGEPYRLCLVIWIFSQDKTGYDRIQNLEILLYHIRCLVNYYNKATFFFISYHVHYLVENAYQR